jgi:hypothetical protein
MEADVAAKQQELLALQQQNVSLRSRTRVLETAQRCSTEIHELMQVLDSLQVRCALRLVRVAWHVCVCVFGEGGAHVHVCVCTCRCAMFSGL